MSTKKDWIVLAAVGVVWLLVLVVAESARGQDLVSDATIATLAADADREAQVARLRAAIASVNSDAAVAWDPGPRGALTLPSEPCLRAAILLSGCTAGERTTLAVAAQVAKKGRDATEKAAAAAARAAARLATPIADYRAAAKARIRARTQQLYVEHQASGVVQGNANAAAAVTAGKGLEDDLDNADTHDEVDAVVDDRQGP